MSKPEQPKGIDPKQLDRGKPISETLKANLAEALRKEFGTGGRVEFRSVFVKQDAPLEVRFGGDIDLAPEHEGPDPGPDLDRGRSAG